MKKIIFMILAAFCAVTLNAQTAVQTSKVLDNTYFGIEGGAATPLSFDHVFPVNPTATLRFGKMFTPVVGTEVEGTGWFGSHDVGASQARFDGLSHNAFRGMYLGLNGVVSLSNLLLDYKGEPRGFEVNAIAGTGWVHQFTPNASDKYSNALGAKTGLEFAFNFGSDKQHTFSVRPSVLWNLSAPGNSNGSLAFNKHGAQIHLGVGYTYRFKTSNGTHSFKVYDVGAMQREINYLRDSLDKKPTEVIREREVVKEVIKEKTVGCSEHVVYFAYDSDVLTSEAKSTLDEVNGSVKVDGYASPEGSEKHNKELSQRRADAVAAYLRTKGVTVVESIGHGVAGDASNRVAIVSVK